MWKERVSRFKGIDFSAFVEDGTIIGHYLIDEPNDPYNWNGQPVPGSTVEDMAAYSKQLWPKMATVVRTEPGYLAEWSGTYRYLDAAWAQYLYRKGDPGDYIRRNVADAKKEGLALVVGLNLIDGGTNGGNMSASLVESAGSTLLGDSYPCAFISWQYDEQYLSRSDIKTAMSHLSAKAAQHAMQSCSGGPLSLPGVSGIALKGSRVYQTGLDYVRLTWSGSTASQIDLYRNGTYRRTTINDGVAVSHPRQAGTYSYKVCDAGTTRCSNTVSVSIQ
jgi:hypothetical protein